MEIYGRGITSYDKKYHVAYGKGVHKNLIKYIVRNIIESFKRAKKDNTYIVYNIRYTALSKHADDFLVMQLKEPMFSLYHNQEAYIIRITDIPIDCLFFKLDSLRLRNISKYRFKLGSHYQWFYKDIPRL